MCSFDSPILFSPQFFFFFFSFTISSSLFLSQSTQFVPNFSPILTTRISERCTQFIDNFLDFALFSLRWVTPILAPQALSSRFHPSIFSIFNSIIRLWFRYSSVLFAYSCLRVRHREQASFFMVVIVDSGDYRERPLPICVKLDPLPTPYPF